MGWLFLLAFFLVGLPLLAPLVDVVIVVGRWVIGSPVTDIDSDGTVVAATAPPRCPSCMSVANDPEAKFCPRCGVTLTAVAQGAEASRAKAIWTRLSIVGLIVTLIAAGLFAAFKLSGAEQKLSRYIDPEHPSTVSFGTSTAPAPADNDKGIKWEIRLQRK